MGEHHVHASANVALKAGALPLQVEQRDARRRRDREGGSG
jgi:hypothetical protein